VLTTVSSEELLIRSDPLGELEFPHPACGHAKFLKVTSSVVLSGFIEPVGKPSLKRLPRL